MNEPIQAEGLAAAGFPTVEIQPLAGDVSPRRYSRAVLAEGGSAILATYPPEIGETCLRFLRTTWILNDAGVRVPRILASAHLEPLISGSKLSAGIFIALAAALLIYLFLWRTTRGLSTLTMLAIAIVMFWSCCGLDSTYPCPIDML